MERYRTTIILVGLLVVLGIAALLVGNQGAGTNPTATPIAATTFVWQDSSPIKGIQVVSGTQRVAMNKDVATTIWTITEPVNASADPFNVGPVSDQLQNLTALTELTGTGDLAEFGLAGSPMQVTFTFSDTAGTERVLLVGDANPDGSAYYVKRGDAASVYLVNNLTIEPLRTWLTAPPVQPPTPTAVPITVVPTSVTAPTSAITGTLTVTATQGLTGTLPITNTVPGAANPTTPELPTIPPVVTPAP